MKLTKHADEYDDKYQEWGWVAHQEACPPLDSVEYDLVQNRYELEIIGGVHDDEASYSYDDWALCKLKGKYYLLATSGCSCPSPSGTWRVEKGPATLAQIKKHIVDGDYDGYTMPKRQLKDFLDLLDKAKESP